MRGRHKGKGYNEECRAVAGMVGTLCMPLLLLPVVLLVVLLVLLLRLLLLPLQVLLLLLLRPLLLQPAGICNVPYAAVPRDGGTRGECAQGMVLCALRFAHELQAARTRALPTRRWKAAALKRR